ncbi:MAG TPA: MmgE/PrpD family protein [Xanthobacteraceae bacterium]|nr:MmgE/PrpD family protein [Xanthobacteraceae bacterium]
MSYGGKRMTALEQLGDYLANGRALPALARASVRLHLIDTVAAWIAGMGTVEGRALIAFRDTLAADAPEGARTAAAIATHTALARLSEIDDIHLAAMTTAGGIVVPAAVTLAASLGPTEPAALARAIAGGYDVMIRLGLALHGPSVLYRGIWPTYLGAGVGVAAVAARLMGLDAGEAAQALALALTTAAPGVGHHNAATTTRWLAIGLAARNGLVAARAARAGFTSDLHLLDGNFFPSVYDIRLARRELTHGLDHHLPILDVAFKPWCAARQTMTATQALKEILARGIAADEITEIEAGVLPPHHGMLDHGVKPGDRASFLTSLPYQMALAALDPDAAFDVQQSPAAVPAPLAALMAKITVTQNERLLARYPKVWPAHVRVATASGAVHEHEIEYVPGDVRMPFDDAQVKAKFRRFVAPRLGAEGVERMLGLAAGVLAGERGAGVLVGEIEELCVL